ncbi:MAG: hypothetical protein KC983_11880, partial [Phycisphaerales bacterium]|nr:hypothetical protein [Phycisphaerales bacterium]
MNRSLTDLQSTSVSRDTVPAPPSRWRTRILLPGVLGAIILGLIALTSTRVFMPSTSVRVVPVVVKSV